MKYDIKLNNRNYIVEISDTKVSVEKNLSIDDDSCMDIPDFDFVEEIQDYNTCISSPMQGMVTEVKVRRGDAIKYGDVLFVIEAMKMENEIIAKRAGIVKEVLVEIGAVVKKNQTLISF